jgi:large subunit ribosomal protein L22
MEPTIARVRDFVRKRVSGERIWRVGVSLTPNALKVTLITPDKPEKLTDERDKGRAPVVEKFERELKSAFGRETIIEVVQASSAVARYIRISPRKCRFVVDAIRNKPVQDALAILQFVPNSAAKTVSKLIKSAIANAENNHRMNADVLEVIHVHVDDGPTLKRISPRSMGRAYHIMKRTSHITVGVAESEKEAKVAKRAKGVARTAGKAPRKSAKAEGGRQKRATKETAAAPAADATEGAAPKKTTRRRQSGGGK